MLYAAVLLSGLGGLLVELVLVRRYGLLLGNTSEASALVIGFYLLGLGLGGLAVVRVVRATQRPLQTAAALYGAVAVAAWALDVLLRAIPPLGWVRGLGLLALTPGVPTLLMGMAFPLVFAGLGEGARRGRVGALVAANLAGSLAATAFGDNWAVPEWGLRATAALASAAYVGAALLVAAAGRGRPAQAPLERAEALPRLAQPALAAALSGGLVVGLQILLLRRLPFYLEGFQPTLSGVLAAVLLGLTLGAAFGTPLLARLFRERAAALALLGAALAMNLGLQEHAVEPLSRLPIATDLEMHARIWLCALAAAGLPCFLLGAVVPLLVAPYGDPSVRSAVAGRLFFWQGVGSVAGSLVAGQLLPALFPRAFFAVAPLALGAVAIVLLARSLPLRVTAPALAAVAAAALLGWSGAGTPFEPAPPLAAKPAPRLRYVDHRTDSTVTASVAYDRSRHSMVLFTNEFRAAETGPFADYMKLLGHLPFLLRDHIERVAVIAFGTGTTARSVVLWPEPSEIHLVEISQAVLSMAPHFAGDGPLREPRTPAFLEDPRTRVHVTDGRRFLALRPPGSLDLITMEPLLAYSPGTASLYTREFYRLAERALSDRGLLMQWVPTHALPNPYFESLLATFAHSFPYHSVWFADGATLLVGSREPHLPEPARLDARLHALPRPIAVSLHEARIAGADDLLAAYLGSDLLAVVGDAPVVSDDRPFVERVGIWKYNGLQAFFYRGNHRVLLRLAARGGAGPFDSDAWTAMRLARVSGYSHLATAMRGRQPLAEARSAVSDLGRAREILPRSVLLYEEETLALRWTTELEVMRRGGRGAAELVDRQLERDAGSALLQASLALPGRGDDRAVPADEAAARAAAISPLFFDEPPPFLRRLAPASPRESPLETLETVPDGAELAPLVVGDDPLAVSLRAAYRVRSARALLDVLARRPLEPREQRALAPLLDPALLDRATRAVRARDGSVEAEILPLWHEGLPRPAPDAAG